MYQLKEAHPISDTMLMLLTENNTSMRHALNRHLDEIGIMGAKDSPHRRCSLQMVFITIAQCI